MFLNCYFTLGSVNHEFGWWAPNVFLYEILFFPCHFLQYGVLKDMLQQHISSIPELLGLVHLRWDDLTHVQCLYIFTTLPMVVTGNYLTTLNSYWELKVVIFFYINPKNYRKLTAPIIFFIRKYRTLCLSSFSVLSVAIEGKSETLFTTGKTNMCCGII